MKLKQAVKHLKELVPDYGDREVYLSRDEEGNGFTPLSRPRGMYGKGTVDGEPVIVLWPGGHQVDLDEEEEDE